MFEFTKVTKISWEIPAAYIKDEAWKGVGVVQYVVYIYKKCAQTQRRVYSTRFVKYVCM